MYCTECDNDLSIPADSISGEVVTCTDCGESFELEVNGKTILLTKSREVGEDWGE